MTKKPKTVGITRYIHYLSNSVKHRPKFVRGAKGSNKGIQDGRRFDSACSEWINRGVYPRTDSLVMARMRLLKGYVKSLRLTDLGTQKTFSLDGISARVDLYGKDINGATVFIELKCTNYNISSFMSMFDNTCTSGERTLANGLPNSIRSRYMIQAGFPSRCVLGSRAYLCVMCKGTGILLRVPDQFTHDSVFCIQPHCNTVSLPTTVGCDTTDVCSVLSRFGYKIISRMSVIGVIKSLRLGKLIIVNFSRVYSRRATNRPVYLDSEKASNEYIYLTRKYTDLVNTKINYVFLRGDVLSVSGYPPQV